MEPKTLSRRDYLYLGLFATALCGFSLIGGRVLTMHESRLPQAAREMFDSGDWLVPSCGGRPWLERPPLPHWITMAVASLCGRCDQVWIVRIPPALMGVLSTLMVGWMAARWFGRTTGLLSAAILATSFQFLRYAWLAEEDIFLAAIVLATLVWFVKLEFPTVADAASVRENPSHAIANQSSESYPTSDPVTPAALAPVFRGEGPGVRGNRSSPSPLTPSPSPPGTGARRANFVTSSLSSLFQSFIGPRSLAVLAFFITLGLTNLVKGLLFGAAMVLIPMAGFLLWNADWSRIKKYVWLPGWIVAIVAAGGWIALASWRHPDLIQLWVKDVVNRTDGVKAGDPFWYYPASLLWCLVPWTIPSLVGLGLTWKTAREQRYSPERFLWCWAILPIALLSIPQHKHHHYLVPCLAPWAILGGLGVQHLWQAIRSLSPAWRNPLWGTLAVTLPAWMILGLFGDRLPGPDGMWLAWSIAITASAWGLFFGMSRPQAHWASGLVFGTVSMLYFAGHLYSGHYVDSYREDTAFLERSRQIVGDDQPIFINGHRTVLNMFRHLFYLGNNARMLHNLTFLRDERILEPEVYVIARYKDAEPLSELGTATVVTESQYHERRSTADTRWTLFRLKFHDNLSRYPNNVTYSARQVMEREPGPFLGRPL